MRETNPQSKAKDTEDEVTSTYRQPKDIAAEVRANIKAAQKSGVLDSKWKISVRTQLASLCSEVAVRIGGDAVTNEFLFGDSGLTGYHRFTVEASAVAEQVRELMGPAIEWEDGRHRFAFLYWRDGLVA